jgi:hypothetical protein
MVGRNALARARNKFDRMTGANSKKQLAMIGTELFANGGVMLTDNFLSKDDFLTVQHWALRVECGLTRRDRNWGIEIIRDFAECMCSRQWSSAEDDMPPEAQMFVDRLRERGMIEQSAIIVLGIYRWQQKSGMGEHTDKHTDTALTFHLNDTWKDNWFGDFVFYESPEAAARGYGRSLTPLANRLVVNKSRVHHKVTYCSDLAAERISIQAFVLKEA